MTIVLNSRMESGCQVPRLDRKKSNRVITPIVAQTAFHQLTVIDEGVHGHELDRGHSQPCEIFDDRSCSQTRIGPAQMSGNVRMAHGESLYVELINQGFVPRNSGWRIGSPGESGVDHPVLRHSGGIVAPVKRQVFLLVSDPVSEVGIAPADGSVNLLAIGVEQKFVVIESVALLRRIGPKHAVPVQLAGTYLRQVAVPDHVSLLGKRNAKRLPFSRNVEQAKFHFLRVLRVEREVDTFTVPG